MNIYIRTHWTNEDNERFVSSLIDGVEIQSLVTLFSRSEKAISRKATDFDFRTKTVNGVKVLKAGIIRRNRRTRAEINATEALAQAEEISLATVTIVDASRTTTNSSIPTTSESLEHLSDAIIAEFTSKYSDISLEVNTKVLTMLQDNDIVINPEVVYQLSKHILNTSENPYAN